MGRESAFWTPCTEVINLPSSQYVMGLAGVSGAGSSWNLLYILDEMSRPKILISWMKESFFEHCPKEAKWPFNHSIKGNLQKYLPNAAKYRWQGRYQTPTSQHWARLPPFWYWMEPAVCGRSLIPSKLSHNCQPGFNVVRSLGQYIVYRCCGHHLHIAKPSTECHHCCCKRDSALQLVSLFHLGAATKGCQDVCQIHSK